jgi:hypothetical protein
MKMTRNASITIAFSSHRVESLPFAKKLMEDHNLIILEDAPAHEFTDMLCKTISIDEYVRGEETEFPEFSRCHCKVLRLLHQKGKEIAQIEPYIEHLIQIHALLSEGKGPSDILKIKGLKTVYETERNTTAALIHFYKASVSDTFQNVIEAVKNFAHADAVRFRLRDTMRAHAIAKILCNKKEVYIEAGGMHIYLEKTLKKILGERSRIHAAYVLAPAIMKITGKSNFFAPGDLLTIHYILNKRKNDNYETLLAARSLIYIKLLVTEEMLPSKHEKNPHLKDELMVKSLVNGLSRAQCEVLFKKIRFQNRKKAHETIHSYLKDSSHAQHSPTMI